MSATTKKLLTSVAAAASVAAFFGIALKIHFARKLIEQHAAIDALEKAGGDMVHLLSFPRWSLAPTVSSPCTKVETFLRITKIPYKLHITDPSVSPTGCLPCIVHNGRRVADSNAIIEYLTDAFHVDLDRTLTSEDKAIGAALSSALDYATKLSFYRTLFTEAPWQTTPYFSRTFGVPKLLALFAVKQFGRRVMRTAHMVGVGHFSREQFEEEFLRDLESIEGVMGDKPFLFGDTPSSVDCAVYAVLLPAIVMEEVMAVSEPFAYAAQSEVLVRYVNRMTRWAFPDWETLMHSPSPMQRSAKRGIGLTEKEEMGKPCARHAKAR